MDFVTFKKVAILLSENISVLIRGKHGIGKSSVIKQIAEEFGLPVIDRRLAQLTEGDLLGLPKIDGESTYFLPLEWFITATKTPCVLFLDEFDRASREVQQAAMELILDRSIQGRKIHEGCRIYSAINGGKHGSSYSVNNIDPAIYDRFWIADIDPSIEEWIEWGKNEGNIYRPILDFIRINPSELEKDPTKNSYDVIPSRRSWTRLSCVLQNNPDLTKNINKNSSLFIAVCSGFVGIHSSGLFRQYLLRPFEHITAEDIIDRFEENEDRLIQFQVEHLNLAISKIVDNCTDKKIKLWTKSQAKNISKFFKILKPELQIAFWDKLTIVGTKIENIQLLSNYVSDMIISATTQ
jgi:hypothetical protein